MSFAVLLVMRRTAFELTPASASSLRRRGSLPGGVSSLNSGWGLQASSPF